MVACCVGQYSEKSQPFYADVIVLIQWHMEAFANPDHYLDEFEKYYGSEMRRIYELVHEADLAAH